MTEKSILISQSNYIPWKGYFDLINSADDFVIYDDVQYSRRDWRNRNRIKTPQGLHWLTVPVVVKGRFGQKINETKIQDLRWAIKHWRTITQNYSRTTFFSSYSRPLEEVYLGNLSPYLSEVNCMLLRCICKLLGIKTRFHWSHDFRVAGDRTERLVEICAKLGGTRYITGPAARAYMNEAVFREAHIGIEYFNYSGYPRYHQPFGEFTHNVSVIDLLFNTGGNAPSLMKTFPVCGGL